MSVRTEPRDLSQQLQQTLTIPADVVAAAGGQQPVAMGAPATGTELVPAEQQLHEANTFNTSNPDHPLHRTMVVSIRASLNDLCLKKTKATWAPSPEAMKNILQQRKFVDLAGSAEQQGDLKSIVMHKMEISAQKNDFPLAVGARITGVDDQTFSVTGESFSTISLPGANSHQSKVLQEDDVSLGAQPPCLNSTLNSHCNHNQHSFHMRVSVRIAAYEFARKFPGVSLAA